VFSVEGVGRTVNDQAVKERRGSPVVGIRGADANNGRVDTGDAARSNETLEKPSRR
jgi:hypothetical protein